MDSMMEAILNMTIDDDIEKWLLKSANGNEIKADEVYFAHTIYIDESQRHSDEEFRILIDSSIKTPHNKFFIDVINRESVSLINGWCGFAMVDNSKRCVDFFEPLSIELGKKVASFEEIQDFINKQNKEIKSKRKKL